MALENMVAADAAQTDGDSKQSAQRFYRPELDSLRFFAFLGVFIFHVVPHDADSYLTHHVLPPAIVPYVCAVSGSGAFGVDLFFALSAYLITTLLIREEEDRRTIDVKAFYVRRILRIWPLYFFFIAVAALAPYWDKTQHLSWHYIAGYLLLAGNWVYVWRGLPHSIANPLWSVSIEEQFYLLWPVALRRLSRRQIVFAALCLLALANLARIWTVSRHGLGASIEYNTFARIDAIAFGILAAYVLGGGTPALRLVARVGLAAGCLFSWLLVAAFVDLNAQTEVAPMGTLIGRPLVALGAAGLLLATMGAPAAGAQFLKNPILTYLGRISYGLYVYHAAGLLLATHLFHRKTVGGYVAFAGAGFAFTVLFSAISYRLLEKPFLRMKEQFAVVRSRPV